MNRLAILALMLGVVNLSVTEQQRAGRYRRGISGGYGGSGGSGCGSGYGGGGGGGGGINERINVKIL